MSLLHMLFAALQFSWPKKYSFMSKKAKIDVSFVILIQFIHHCRITRSLYIIVLWTQSSITEPNVRLPQECAELLVFLKNALNCIRGLIDVLGLNCICTEFLLLECSIYCLCPATILEFRTDSYLSW